MNNPVAFKFDGKAMIPINPFFAARASKQYEPGQVYVLVPQEARSPESHNHFFAALHEGWLNLAEEYADEFPTSAHLRAWCLVKAGFADRNTIVCASPEDAIRAAAIASTRDKIRIIEVAGRTVTVWIPHSMSRAAMGKERFQAAKTSVLDIIATMTHSTRQELEKNAGQSA